MSSDIAFDPTWETVVSNIEDGDDADGAVFSAPLEQLSHRTDWLKKSLSDGVNRIRIVDEIVTMKDIDVTTVLPGDAVIVEQEGLFRFTTSVFADDGKTQIAPYAGVGTWLKVERGMREASSLSTMALLDNLARGELILVPGVGVYRFTDLSAGGDGYWKVNHGSISGSFTRVEYGLILTNGGVSGSAIRLDPAKAPVPNRIVSISEISPTSGSFAPASSSPGTAFGPTLTLAVQEGDIVEIEGQIALVEDNAANLSVILRSGSTVLGNGKAILKTTATLPVRIFTRHVALATETLSIQFGGICSSATSTSFTEAGIVARLVRP